jgi:hypothetical protein
VWRQRTLPRAGATILLAWLAFVDGGCGSSLSSADLRQHVATIASVATEGRLLAEDVGSGRSHPAFVRVHARELAGNADDEAETLADASASGELAARRVRGVTVAEDVSSTLGELQVMPKDKGVAARAAVQLRRLASQARGLR